MDNLTFTTVEFKPVATTGWGSRLCQLWRLHPHNIYFLGPGELIGEIGLFSPEKVRTMTVVCETDCELYQMTDEQIYRLYYQNPKLGFFFMRLIVERLLRDVKRGAIESGTV